MDSDNICCKHCDKSFTRISSYRRHIELNRCSVLHADSDADSESSETECVSCTTCGKSFHNKYNLKRHNNTVCKMVPFKRMEEIVTTIVKSIDSNTLLNGEKDKKEVIKIHPIGQEDLSHITKARKLSILRKGMGAVAALVRAILELPENRNIAVSDKRNKKVTFKNRDGELEIASQDKVLHMYTTDNIDRIDEFLDELYKELSLKDKTILRLMEAQKFVIPGEEENGIILVDGLTFDSYYDICMGRIFDVLCLNKKSIVEHMNKYIAYTT